MICQHISPLRRAQADGDKLLFSAGLYEAGGRLSSNDIRKKRYRWLLLQQYLPLDLLQV